MQTKQHFNFDSSAKNLANLAELDEHIDKIHSELLFVRGKEAEVMLSTLDALFKVRIELLLRLSSDEDRRVRKEAVRCLGKFVNEFPIHIRHLTKLNKMLIRLAKDEDKLVRQEVAQNIHTPSEALARLAKDEDKLVRLRVASNRNTPSEVLASVAEDEQRRTQQNG